MTRCHVFFKYCHCLPNSRFVPLRRHVVMSENVSPLSRPSSEPSGGTQSHGSIHGGPEGAFSVAPRFSFQASPVLCLPSFAELSAVASVSFSDTILSVEGRAEVATSVLARQEYTCRCRGRRGVGRSSGRYRPPSPQNRRGPLFLCLCL